MGCGVSREHRLKPRAANQLSKSAAIDSTVLLTSTAHTDVQQHYQFKKVLGHGQFGTVREAVFIGSNRKVAIKSVSKEKVKKDLVLLKRELEVMRLIDHPNLIKYYQAYEDDRYIHLVMELCTGGDLLEKLSCQGSLDEGKVKAIMRKLMLAVRYLHEMGVCHRDLKPDNFLFVDREDGSEIKIIDFGMSIKQQNVSLMTSFVGTPYYLAPEVITGNYGMECDIWSLGVVMFVMLSGVQPFDGDSLTEIMQRITRGDYEFESEYWQQVSFTAKDLLRLMLVVRPSNRITLQKALEHAWFKDTCAHPLSTKVLISLKEYKAPKKLYREMMKVMIKFLSAGDIEELKHAFMELDRDHSGFVSLEILESTLNSLGFEVPSEEVKSTIYTEIAQSIGEIGTRNIKYSDFLVAVLDKKKLMDAELLYLTFQHFDGDGDGFINVQDLKTALENVGDSSSVAEIEDMIAEWDLDKNRQIDFDEFRKMVESFKDPAPEQKPPGTRRATVARKTLARIVHQEEDE